MPYTFVGDLVILAQFRLYYRWIGVYTLVVIKTGPTCMQYVYISCFELQFARMNFSRNFFTKFFTNFFFFWFGKRERKKLHCFQNNKDYFQSCTEIFDDGEYSVVVHGPIFGSDYCQPLALLLPTATAAPARACASMQCTGTPNNAVCWCWYCTTSADISHARAPSAW